jgi:TonB-dependent starch-binding outer membrane protein SusC
MLNHYLHKWGASLIFLLFFGVVTAQAQNDFFKVIGTVQDKTGEGLPSVNVQLKGNIVSVVTDLEGKYNINLSNKNATLVFSCVGFRTQEIEVDGKKIIDIILEEDLTQLQDAVVVGYGSQKKSVVTGAIASVRNKDFKDQPVANIASSIQSKVSGVNVTTPSGTPGAGLLVSIRGASNPLYVVDGIPIVSESNSAITNSYDLEGNITGQSQNISSIADINPNDIESVEVLKDASAASIYGVRAANGVVLITTKRGSTDRTEIGINTYAGIQKVARAPQFLSSTEMVDLIEEGRANDLALYNQDNTIFGDGFNKDILTKPLNDSWRTGVNTNWLDQIFQTAPIYNVEVFARGGNPKTRFHISGNYFDQTGIMVNSGYKRYTGRINLDHKVNDRFSIGNTLNLTRSDNRRVFNDDTYSGILTNAQGADPLMPPYEEDGSYADFTNYHTNWLSDNPLKSANEIKATTTSNRVLGSVFGEYRFSPSFKFKSTWSLDYTDLKDDQYFDPSTTDGEVAIGRAVYASHNNTTWLGENYFIFKKNILEDHNLEFIAGNSLQKSQTERGFVSGQGFVKGSGLQLLGSAAQINNAPINATQWSLMSFMARVNYDFKNKIILAASVRTDGSSRFSADNRFATFPSASLGYRFIDNSKWENNQSPLLSDLKFRVSYGVTGDQEIGDFRNRTLWKPASYLGQPGLRQSNIADSTLGWQQNTMLNAGIDFEFKKGRYGGSIEVFQGNKTRLLTDAIIAGTTGFSTVTRNAGKIENKGLEFQLYGTPINTGRFRMNVNFNATFLRNTIKELQQDGELLYIYSDVSASHILKVGESVGTFWGIKATGVNPATGDMEYEDINGDGEITLDDGQIIGKAMPDVFGGLNFNFAYKNLDFSIANSYSLGNDVYNFNRYFFLNTGWANEGWDENGELQQIFANPTVEVRNRWKKPGDVTNIPRASLVNQTFFETNSSFVEDGSFWRVRTINIGYTMRPKNGKKWFNQARAFAQVQNPFVFTKYSWFDPEVSTNGGGSDRTAGADYATYPQARTYTVGVNMTF